MNVSAYFFTLAFLNGHPWLVWDALPGPGYGYMLLQTTRTGNSVQ